MHTMLITDGSLGSDPTLLEKLEQACKAGIDAIQLREKQAETKELYDFAKKLREITWEYGVSLFINERIDLALAVQANGVHLPENGLSPQDLKKFPLQIGMSVHSLEAAIDAEKEGADYLIFSPIFEPLSKTSPLLPQGLTQLKIVAKSTKIPIIALGGITAEKIPDLMQSGAAGVAAIASLLHAQDISAAVAAFKAPFIKKKKDINGLLVILSSLDTAKQAIQGGADAIEFRHKGPYTQESFELAKEIRRLCQKANIPYIINDRADIALALQADGVHLGQTDLPIPAAKKILGPNKLIGKTASTVQEAIEAEKSGADYIGLGHIFSTQSKAKTYPPIGLETLKKAKESVKIPLIAIGGINLENAPSVLQAGADGISVIAAIAQAPNPVDNAKKLKKLFQK